MHQPSLTPIVWALLTLAGNLSMAPAAQAQDSAASTAQAGDAKLDEVTVIGTVDSLQSLSFYAPNSSAVLKREDLEAQGARKLDQALHYQAGVQSEPY